MFVAKFGGTSVADAAALRQVDAVVRTFADEPGGVIIVLSATSGTTTQLLDILRRAGGGQAYEADLEMLLKRHEMIATDLIGSADCIRELGRSCREFASAVAELGEWNDATLDAFVAYGELLSTSIYDAYRRATGQSSTWIDARTLIITDDRFQRAVVDDITTTNRCRSVLSPLCIDGAVIVTQGFIASSQDGMTTTLGRGGSDYSAAIIGASIGAQAIRIYTDVSGVYTCDPRLVHTARPLTTIAFNEMRDMATFGAKVLHPDTIEPAVKALIPVHVLNTFCPDEPGTLITDHDASGTIIRAVSLLRGISTIITDAPQGAMLTQHDALQSHVVLSIASTNRHTICMQIISESASAMLEAIALAHGIRCEPTCIVTITGQRLDRPQIVSELSALLDEHTDRAQIAVISTTCVVAIVPAEVGEVCVRAVHEAIIRPQVPGE